MRKNDNKIPKAIIEYASEYGFDTCEVYITINGVVYYEISKERHSSDSKSHKIGLPVLVKIEKEKIVRLHSNEILRLIIIRKERE